MSRGVSSPPERVRALGPLLAPAAGAQPGELDLPAARGPEAGGPFITTCCPRCHDDGQVFDAAVEEQSLAASTLERPTGGTPERP